MTMPSSAMQVILGVASLKAYVTAPKTFHVLGIVRFGQEFGLLATNAEGVYFRVNGSHVAALDTGSVRRAMDHAQGRISKRSQPALRGTPAQAHHVVVRKHRRAVEPPSA